MSSRKFNKIKNESSYEENFLDWQKLIENFEQLKKDSAASINATSIDQPSTSRSQIANGISPSVNSLQSNYEILSKELNSKNIKIQETTKKQKADMNFFKNSLFQPHRKHCHNENIDFSNICGVFPNIDETFIWKIFVDQDGDAEQVFNFLCDMNLPVKFKSGSRLSCNCTNHSESSLEVGKQEQIFKADQELAMKLSLQENSQNKSKNEFNDFPVPLPANEGAFRENFEKLLKLFPSVNKTVLTQTFSGNSYNFQETFDDLNENFKTFKNSSNEFTEITRSRKKKRKNQLPNKESLEKNGSNYSIKDLEALENLRKEISELRDSQKDCTRKAQEAFERHQPDCEVHLRNIAILYKEKAEKAEHEAENLVMEIHEYSNPETQLDLHFLKLIGASCILEIFLDKHIEILRTSRKKYEKLSIITGRGKHSPNGIANIKIDTIFQLQQRKLTFTEGNPGMLCVKVHANSPMTHEINRSSFS